MSLQHTFTDPSYRQDDKDGMNVMVQGSKFQVQGLKFKPFN